MADPDVQKIRQLFDGDVVGITRDAKIPETEPANHTNDEDDQPDDA